MERISDILHYLFPVYIIDRTEFLHIEDRRPTLRMLSAAPAALGFIGFTIYWLAFVGFREGPWVPIGMGVTGVILAAMAMTANFREVYIFDRSRDTYVFTRQSVLKKDVVEGTLSQFRAVQVEERQAEENSFPMVVLHQQGILLSGADTQDLRATPVLFSDRAMESRIASAISKYLKIKRVDRPESDDEEDLTILEIPR